MKTTSIVILFIVTVFALVWFFPFASTLITMIKNPDQFNSIFFWKLPSLIEIPRNLMGNIIEAQEKAKIFSNIGNSGLYAVLAGSLSSFLAAMAAYALVILKAPGSKYWFLFIFLGNLFPFQMFLIPLYLLTSNLGLYDTFVGMLIVYTGICIPFAVFVYRNYSRSMQFATFEASRIDGAGDWQTFFYIFLPMSRPAFLVVFIFQFTWTWNDLLFGLVLSESKRPIMTAISKLVGQRGAVPVPITMTGALMAAVPTIILLLALQKHFIRGFSIVSEK